MWWMVSTRLWTKNTCPPRSISRRIASAITSSSYSRISVCTGRRSRGGVSITDMSRAPARLRLSVRGIGVAVIASTSTEPRDLAHASPSARRRSGAPRRSPPGRGRLKRTSFDSSRWVPITMSTSPRREPRQRSSFCSFGVRKRDSTSTCTGKSASRSRNVSRCCCARIVVGTSTATCLPSCTTLNAARIATSVLP